MRGPGRLQGDVAIPADGEGLAPEALLTKLVLEGLAAAADTTIRWHADIQEDVRRAVRSGPYQSFASHKCSSEAEPDPVAFRSSM